MNTTGIHSEKRRGLARECLRLAERIDRACRGVSIGLVNTMVECDALEDKLRVLRDIVTAPNASNRFFNLGLIALVVSNFCHLIFGTG